MSSLSKSGSVDRDPSSPLHTLLGHPAPYIWRDDAVAYKDDELEGCASSNEKQHVSLWDYRGSKWVILRFVPVSTIDVHATFASRRAEFRALNTEMITVLPSVPKLVPKLVPRKMTVERSLSQNNSGAASDSPRFPILIDSCGRIAKAYHVEKGESAIFIIDLQGIVRHAIVTETISTPTDVVRLLLGTQLKRDRVNSISSESGPAKTPPRTLSTGLLSRSGSFTTSDNTSEGPRPCSARFKSSVSSMPLGSTQGKVEEKTVERKQKSYEVEEVRELRKNLLKRRETFYK